MREDPNANKWERMMSYQEELKNQIETKKSLENMKRGSVDKSHMNRSMYEYERRDKDEADKKRKVKEEFVKENQSLMDYRNSQKEENEKSVRNEDVIRLKKNFDEKVREETEVYLKKNKYQKYLMDSLNKQIEDKKKANQIYEKGLKNRMNVSARDFNHTMRSKKSSNSVISKNDR